MRQRLILVLVGLALAAPNRTMALQAESEEVFATEGAGCYLGNAELEGFMAGENAWNQDDDESKGVIVTEDAGYYLSDAELEEFVAGEDVWNQSDAESEPLIGAESAGYYLGDGELEEFVAGENAWYYASQDLGADENSDASGDEDEPNDEDDSALQSVAPLIGLEGDARGPEKPGYWGNPFTNS
jgi:hypothetical protein